MQKNVPQPRETVAVKFVIGTPQSDAWTALRTVCSRFPTAAAQPVFPHEEDMELATMFTIDVDVGIDRREIVLAVKELKGVEFAQIAPDRRIV